MCVGGGGGVGVGVCGGGFGSFVPALDAGLIGTHFS